jgi:hypothetical protein
VPAETKEILRYFLRNPQAADNLEGVVRWRLMEARVHRSVERVDQALDWLVAEGFLLKESAMFTDPIFRLNREKDGEARGFVTRVGTPRRRHKQRH